MENNVHIIELSGYTAPQIVEDKRKEWVTFGEDNTYYDYLIACHRDSVTNMSIINNMSRLIYGRGIHALNASKKVNEYAQMKSLFSAPTLRKIVKELKQLGQCALQVAYNKNHTKVLRVEYIPVKQLAPNKMNEDGDIDSYWYSDDWSDVRKFEPKQYSAFGFSKDELEILFIQPFTVGMNYFSDVDYAAALIYAELEGEMAEYQMNDIQNGFAPTTIVNFNNGVPTPEQQKLTANKVEGKLTGAKGKKTITSFNANAESATTVDSIPLNDAPDHYAYLAKEAQQKILNAHNVISPFLVGITSEGSGFSSSADEIEIASKYFYNIAIKPFQDLLIDAIEQVLSFNGVNGLDLYFQRLNLLESVEEDAQAQESVEMSAHLDGLLAGFGEVVDEDKWSLIDERDVDYDQEEEFDKQIKIYADSLIHNNNLVQDGGFSK